MRTIGWGLSMALLAVLMVSSVGAQAPASGAAIFVVDFGNNRIVRIDDMTGTGWTTLGGPAAGWGTNQFSFLYGGVSVDAAGRIYVADFGNDRIVRMKDMTGAGWTTLGTPGSGVNQFRGPTGVSVDAAGRIYVADADNNWVVRVNDMTGSGWATLGNSGNGKGQFSAPRGIFVR